MAFNLTDFMNSESMNLSKREEKTEVVMLPVSKLVPSGGNFYSKEDERIRKLAATIEVLATEEQSGVQDNLVVKPIDGSDKYEILAGETRWSAVNLLLEEGRIKSEMVPCRVESSGDAVREEMILIFTNSTQRVRSDAEKMHEVERLRELLTEYKKTHSLGGTMQQAIAEILSMSKSKVGTLEHINKSLTKPLLKMYEEGKIPTSVANRIAGFEKEEQESFTGFVEHTKTDYVTGDLVDGFHISYMHRSMEEEPETTEEPGDEEQTGTGQAFSFQLDAPASGEQVETNSVSFQMPVPAMEDPEDKGDVKPEEKQKTEELKQEEKVEDAEQKPERRESPKDIEAFLEAEFNKRFNARKTVNVVQREIEKYEFYYSHTKTLLKYAKKAKNEDSHIERLCKYKVILSALKKYKAFLEGRDE